MFPVRVISYSSHLNGQTNGKLDTSILSMTPGQAGGATVVLVHPAARAWRALCAAAKQAGHILKATSVADSYRIYEIQERIFRDRYTTTYLPGRPYRMWQGRRWYQKPGTAVAAVPGTSNHGWASAVDTGEERDSDAAAESLDDPTLRWLLDHEQTYGWSHEVQSEPWHLRYFAGDAIPKAVLAYEQSSQQPPPPKEDDLVYKIVWIKSGTKPGAAYRVLFAKGKDGKDFPVEAHDIGSENDPQNLAGWRKRLEEVPSSKPLPPSPYIRIVDGPYANVGG